MASSRSPAVPSQASEIPAHTAIHGWVVQTVDDAEIVGVLNDDRSNRLRIRGPRRCSIAEARLDDGVPRTLSERAYGLPPPRIDALAHQRSGLAGRGRGQVDALDQSGRPVVQR